MTYKIENSLIGLKDTLPEEVELIFEMEKQDDNVKFVSPYDKMRHLDFHMHRKIKVTFSRILFF